MLQYQFLCGKVPRTDFGVLQHVFERIVAFDGAQYSIHCLCVQICVCVCVCVCKYTLFFMPLPTISYPHNGVSNAILFCGCYSHKSSSVQHAITYFSYVHALPFPCMHTHTQAKTSQLHAPHLKRDTPRHYTDYRQHLPGQPSLVVCRP